MEFENNAPAPTTEGSSTPDLSEGNFTIRTETPASTTPPLTTPVAKEEPTTEKPPVQPEGGSENKAGGDQKPEATTTTKDNAAEPTAEPEYEYITAKDLAPILSDATNGYIKDVPQLHSIIQENERLKAQIADPTSLFKDENQKSLFKWLTDFKSKDYGTGIQTYAKLQSMDLDKMDAKSIMKEAYIIDGVKKGLSPDKLEQMFEVIHEKKFGEYGDLADEFQKAEAIEAREKLLKMKEEFTPKEDTSEKQVQEQRQQAAEMWNSWVDKTLKAENGDEYKAVHYEGLTDNPEENFVFEVPDVKAVEEAMRDFDTFFTNRYISKEGLNAELLKMDLTAIMNHDAMMANMFEHGKTIGKLHAINERTNTPAKGTPPSNAPQTQNGHKSIEDAILSGSMRTVKI